MPTWRIKPVNYFPSAWRIALFEPFEQWKTLEAVYTDREVNRLRERFRFFRFCLRAYPHSEPGLIESTMSIQTRVVRNHDTWKWELHVRVMPGIVSLLSNPEVLRTEVDAIERMG